MKQILVEIDERTASELERVAPAKTRKRSEFIRWALRRALWDREERSTRDAYLRNPDQEGGTYLDPRTWEPIRSPRRVKR